MFKAPYADKQLRQIGPLEFITYIRNAKCVISNSFHATAFSLIFNKEFFVFNRTENINTRMHDLLNILGIRKRLIINLKYLQNADIIDYNKIEKFFWGCSGNRRITLQIL